MPNRPGAGRPKGSANKRSIEFREKFEAACKQRGYDLVEVLADLCRDNDKKIVLQAARLVLPYCWPALRSIDLHMDDDTRASFGLTINRPKVNGHDTELNSEGNPRHLAAPGTITPELLAQMMD